MKKIIFFLILLALIQNQSSAQALGWEWSKYASGSDNDYGYGITTDSNGNIYVTGSYAGTTLTLGTTTLFNSAGSGMFISKYDPLGNLLWAKTQAGEGAAVGFGVAVDGNGNAFVTGGYSNQSVIFGTYTLSCAGINDVFIVKYDPNGAVLWARSAGGTNSDYGKSISADQNGNVSITGYFRSPSIVFGTNTLTCVSVGNDVFITKYDSNGNVLWAESAGGTNSDEGRSISTDNSGNVLVTGNFISTSIIFGTYTLSNTGNSDLFIVKYDPNGTVLWANSVGGTLTEGCNGISIDLNSNIYVTGQFSSASLVFGTHTLTNSNSPTATMFIAKYDALGNALWAKEFGLGASTGVCNDSGGNVYVSGSFNGTSMTFGTSLLINNGSTDVFALKFDGLGNELSAATAGGNFNDRGGAICLDSNGNIFLTGTFESPLVMFGATTLNNINSSTSDVFVAKLVVCTAAPLSPTDVTSFNNKNICDASLTTLSVTSSGIVNWYASPTSTLALANGYSFITPNLSIGTYTYYAEAYTCTNSISRTSIVVTVDACTSIEDLTNPPSLFSIYPNPFQDKLIIDSRELVIENISISNSLGQMILQQNKYDTSRYLDLSALPIGIYFLKLEGEGRQSVFKVIKK
jgi:hypothetical protein